MQTKSRTTTSATASFKYYWQHNTTLSLNKNAQPICYDGHALVLRVLRRSSMQQSVSALHSYYFMGKKRSNICLRATKMSLCKCVIIFAKGITCRCHFTFRCTENHYSPLKSPLGVATNQNAVKQIQMCINSEGSPKHHI